MSKRKELLIFVNLVFRMMISLIVFAIGVYFLLSSIEYFLTNPFIFGIRLTIGSIIMISPTLIIYELNIDIVNHLK